MGGFSFLFPAFLAGLAAAALPILIHLIHRKKSKVLPFSSLLFLRLVEKRIARRRRLEEFLVLLFRVLALALLALALAAPVSRKAGGGRMSVARVLLLDDSLSMSLAPAGGPTLLERAKETARALLAPLSSRDSAALLTLHQESEEPARLSRNLASLEERLQKTAPTLGDTPLNDGIRRALSLLAGAPAAVKDLVLLTDRQSRAVKEVRASRILERLPKGTRLFLASPGDSAFSNLTLRSVLVRPLPSSGRGHRVLVSVSNPSGAPLSALLTLEVEGAARTVREIRVPPGGTADFPFDLPGTGDKERVGRAFLSADELPADDERWFLLPKRTPLPVLVISNSRISIPRLDPAFYLVRALGPGEESTIAPERTDPAGAASRDLSSFGVVVLADSAPLPAETRAALKRYLEGGGGVLAFLGPGSEEDTFLQISKDLGIRVGAVAGGGKEGRPFTFTALDRRHPALAPLFATSPPVRLGLARIFRYRRLSSLPPGSEIPARFTGGDPALVEIRLGKGRLLAAATTANPEWNDLAWRVSYVPFLHSLVHALAPPGPTGGEEWVPERPILLSWPDGKAAPLEVVLSAGPVHRSVRGRKRGEGVEFPLGILHKTGVARLELRGRGAARSYRVPVNIDPGEGDPRRDPWKDFPGASIPLDDPAAAAEAVESNLLGLSLADPLAVLAFLFLLAEGLLAARIAFGGGRE